MRVTLQWQVSVIKFAAEWLETVELAAELNLLLKALNVFWRRENEWNLWIVKWWENLISKFGSSVHFIAYLSMIGYVVSCGEWWVVYFFLSEELLLASDVKYFIDLLSLICYVFMLALSNLLVHGWVRCHGKDTFSLTSSKKLGRIIRVNFECIW